MHRLVFILLMSVPLVAQTYSISGLVTDPDGKPVSEVHVTLTPGFFTLYTSQDGSFRFDGLFPGSYTLAFQHIGFLTSRVKDVTVQDSDIIMQPFTLEFDVLDLENVIVTASQAERDVVEIPESVNLVSSREIRERNSKTSAEALREEVGVFVQKTNHGGGSAIIRGFSSNQILLLVDGIRLNNSIYRLGNHQYLTTIDHQMVEKIEVVRGPTSVLYGSDALGGTVNLITRKPPVNDNEKSLGVRSLLRYATADQEKTVRGELISSSRRYAFSTAFSLKQFGDLRRGANGNDHEISGNELVQSPTGFGGYDIDTKLITNLTDDQTITLAHQFSKQEKVPRYDKYHYNGYHRWFFHPQDRMLTYAMYENKDINIIFDAVRATASLHLQKEGRKTQKNESSSIQNELDEVATKGFSVSGIRERDRHQIVAGAELYHDDVASERSYSDPLTGAGTDDNRGRYPDDATYLSIGFYLQDEMKMTDRWMLKLGVRQSQYRAEFDMNSAALYSQTFSSFTGAVGSVFRLSNYVSANLNLAQAFRAPNLSDMAKLGESKGDIYEVPNPDLQPEKLMNIDMGLKISTESMRVDFTVYRSFITDLLASVDATYAGADTIVIDSQMFNVKTKKNLGEAIIQGTEIAVDYSLSGSLSFRGNLTTTYGENITYNEPVGGIPPIFGLAGVRWSRGRFFLDGYSRFAVRQDRLSADDLDDPRIPPEGTPGWFTLNLRGGVTLRQSLIVQIACENILDRNYREHGSGVNGPGRNWVISFQMTR